MWAVGASPALSVQLWLGGFDRSLRGVLLSPLARQTLGMLTSTEEHRGT